MQSLIGPRREKTCLQWFANNKSVDQPAHARRLISALAVRFLERIISKLATAEISIIQQVSVAEQAGLNLTLSETPEDRFCHVESTLSLWYNLPKRTFNYTPCLILIFSKSTY